MTVLSTHEHTNEHCLPMPFIHCFIQTKHKVFRSFTIFELYSTHSSHHKSLCPSKHLHPTFFQTPCFTSKQNCWPYITLTNAPVSVRGNLLPYSNSLHSLNITNRHLVLAVTATSHTPLTLTLLPRYVNSLLLFPLHHITFLPAPPPLQYFRHIFCM